ncbi:MAG: DUF4430 domain-containing protein [Oscillospiraceae bacterium]
MLEKIKRNKTKIIAVSVIFVVLLIAFCFGGKNTASNIGNNTGQTSKTSSQDIQKATEASPSASPNLAASSEAETKTATEKENLNVSEKPVATQTPAQTKPHDAAKAPVATPEHVTEADVKYSESHGMDIKEDTGKDKYATEPVPEGEKTPVEPETVTVSDTEKTCTLTVKCDTILPNISNFDTNKLDIVPKDGIIFATKSVSFNEGESVFNVLLREMKKNKIHFEFTNTPIYNSAYIEGINNIYEFDCGELSGWMYRVNDWFPNYGCSRYQIEDGDNIELLYTCDLGRDIGGEYSAGQQR